MWRLIVSRPRSALTSSLRGQVVSLSVLCAKPRANKPRTKTKTPSLGPKGLLTPLPAPPRRGADATGAACVRWGAEYDALRRRRMFATGQPVLVQTHALTCLVRLSN